MTDYTLNLRQFLVLSQTPYCYDHCGNKWQCEDQWVDMFRIKLLHDVCHPSYAVPEGVCGRLVDA